MENRYTYEAYMKKVTDSFISMQDNEGYFRIEWEGGLEFTKVYDGVGFRISGMTYEETIEYNSDVALEYLQTNTLTYKEWEACYQQN